MLNFLWLSISSASSIRKNGPCRLHLAAAPGLVLHGHFGKGWQVRMPIIWRQGEKMMNFPSRAQRVGNSQVYLVPKKKQTSKLFWFCSQINLLVWCWFTWMDGGLGVKDLQNVPKGHENVPKGHGPLLLKVFADDVKTCSSKRPNLIIFIEDSNYYQLPS